MNRNEMWDRIADPDARPWDVIIIGGGATGLGAALDAVSRGYRTVLLEANDFAKGTSSRSTKIIHGGVRYLRQGQIGLVRDSLKERGLLIRNCPELVTERGFIVPHYRSWERWYYGVGLKVYDALAGKFGLTPSRSLSAAETLEALPTLRPEGLKGGTYYVDGQFDDARLAVCVAMAVAEKGGTVLNHARVEDLLKDEESGKIRGVRVRNSECGAEADVHGQVVINATGPFSDSVRKMEDAEVGTLVAPSQGIHVVLPECFLPSADAIMIPKTDDGRLLFVIPWNGKILAGTTDTPQDESLLEPIPEEEEIDYLINHLGRYLSPAPERKDVLSIFAGLRPLVKPSGDAGNSASISRDHTIETSSGGLVTIVGGKWTTFRKMGEDVVTHASKKGALELRPSATEEIAIGGCGLPATVSVGTALHKALEITDAHVIAAVKNEMARTVEDVLSRRTRSLLLDAAASIAIAPKVAEIMAGELGRDAAWVEAQIREFESVATAYVAAV